jgi:hypothetical protein
VGRAGGRIGGWWWWWGGMTSERGVGGSRGELDVEVDERVRVGVVLDCDAADGSTYLTGVVLDCEHTSQASCWTATRQHIPAYLTSVVLDCDTATHTSMPQGQDIPSRLRGNTYQHASEATHTSMPHKFGIIGSAVVLYCGTAPRRSAARGGDGKVTSNSAFTALATAPLLHSLPRLYSALYRAFTAIFTGRSAWL